MKAPATLLTAACLGALAPRATGAEQAALGAKADANAVASDATAEGEGTASRGDEPRPESGFQNALRLGLTLPAGVTSEGQALGDDVARRVSVIGDVGYRLNRRWFLGIMGMVGLDQAADGCGLAGDSADVNCTLEGWRLGVELFAHPLNSGSLDLWLGGGLAWEHLEARVIIPPPAGTTTTPSRLSSSHEGPALDLAAGIDFPIEGKLAAGPFIGYTGGMFVGRSSECPDASSCPANEIDEAGIHHWFTLGARGRFGP